MDYPRIAIILVNWNAAQYTIECLASLQKLDYPNFETILIDNGSVDHSPTIIRQAFPGIMLLEMGENLGFVEGNNVGIREAQRRGAELVLLLNNDTEVDPDCLSRMVDVIQSDTKIGIVGPTIYYHSLPDTIWSAGGEIIWRAGLTRMMNLGEKDYGQLGTQPRKVDFVTGCALLIKMTAIQEAGLLDQRFFAYFEEAEWCVRVNRAGYQIMHIPDAKIWHKISLEAREASPMVHYYMIRNRLLFLKLTKASFGAWIYTLFFDYLRTLLSWWFRPKWHHKKDQRAMMVKAIVDYFLGRYGKLA
jgi:GT2 family glycosyltransferase